MIVQPFYRDDLTTVYHGDAERLVKLVAMTAAPDPRRIFVLTDPPYGVKENTNRGERQRSALAQAKDFAPVIGDDRPFDPTFLLPYPWRLALFGANYYAGKLPASPSWLVWDKLDGLTTEKRILGFNDNADVEMIWTNLGGPARILRHRWMGIMKGSEHGQRRVHPTQKPVAIMAAILDLFAWDSDTIVDFYAGSGPTILAARLLGIPSVAVEIDRGYCETIVDRIKRQTALGLDRSRTVSCHE